MNARHCRAALLLSASLAACSKPPAPPPPVAAIQPAPAHAPSPAAGAPGGAASGPVLETMDAAGYTYVKVKGDAGDVWAAAPQFPVKVGDRVRVQLEMPMVNFHSTSLNRDFPVLYFVTRITPDDGTAPAAADAAAPQPPPATHGAPASTVPSVTTPMPAPDGGVTIARLWADRKTLAGKQVTVHGVVVKYNGGILGVNWIHLQDGTGKAADGSNDITVTSAQDVPVAVGDTIVATGTAALDKNIGSGYAYPVLVENARLSAVKKTAGS